MKARVLKQIQRHKKRLDDEFAFRTHEMQVDLNRRFLDSTKRVVGWGKESRTLAAVTMVNPRDLQTIHADKDYFTREQGSYVRRMLAQQFAALIVEDDRIMDLNIRPDEYSGMLMVEGRMDVLVKVRRLKMALSDDGMRVEWKEVRC